MNKYASVIMACVFFLTIIFIPSLALPDNSKQQIRPKTALVLGGGGARGIAHLGIIQALEELQVPVDIIVGTSMGSIVGGLYASGMSSEELNRLVDLDWSTIFRNDPDREKLRYRVKKDDYKYMLKYGMGFKNGKIVLPKGLIQGQKQFILFNRYTYDLYDMDSFDDFPIQYRAVATDIETGSPVILDSGNLANAIRASMSIPGIFSPVEIDGKMLVDGGLVNNLPIDIAQQLGADVIIAVDVGSLLDSGEELSSIFKISGQLTTLMVRKNSNEQIERFKKEYMVTDDGESGGLHGILLRPQLNDISASDFTKGHDAVRIGWEAVMKQSEKLKTFSVSETEYKSFRLKQRKPETEPIILDFIEIDNQSHLSDNVIRSFIKFNEGSVLDIEKLEKNISDLYGLDTFERVEYRIVQRGEQTGLVLISVEKAWSPNYIGLGYNMYTNLAGYGGSNLGFSLTRNPVNRLGGEWKNEFQFGETDRFYSEFYQPLDYNMRFFVAPYVEAEREYQHLYDDSGHDIVKFRVRTYEAGLDAGRQFGNWGSFRFGVRWVDGRNEVKTGDPGFGTYQYNRIGFQTSFNYDTLDDITFPTRGIRAELSCDFDREEMGSDESVETCHVKADGAITWGRYSLVPGIDVNTVSDDTVSIEYASQVGGFLNISGLIPNELTGLHTGVGRMVLYRDMGKVFSKTWYLGASLELGNAWNTYDSFDLDSLLLAGSAFASTNTYIGQFYLAYGMTESGRNSFYIFLGKPF